jgi:signal transduction histidine kinase
VDAGDVITWRIEPASIESWVSVSVHNGGNPIPPELLAKLGTPFFTTKPSGNGLGLAIVRRIVEAHNGRLSIQSSADAGTTIGIELPFSC